MLLRALEVDDSPGEGLLGTVIEPAGEPAQRIVPEVEDPLSLVQKRLRTLGGGVSDFGARLLVLSLDRVSSPGPPMPSHRIDTRRTRSFN
jgi:hypothetical protein